MAVVDTPVGDYLHALASTASVPGGGSAAALAAAMGAALLSMVSKLSAKKAPPGDAESLLARVPELDHLCERLAELSQHDIDAYRAVVTAKKAARDQQTPNGAVQAALERATSVPLETATLAGQGLAFAATLAPFIWTMVASDFQAGRELLRTGFNGAMANVAINLPDLEGPARSRLETAYQDLAARHPGV